LDKLPSEKTESAKAFFDKAKIDIKSSNINLISYKNLFIFQTIIYPQKQHEEKLKQ
jgi:hypothetical protein